MISKHNFAVPVIFFISLFVSPNLFAAGKCIEVRTESTFELINAPAQEMQNFRNTSEAISCVFLKDFIARSRMPVNSYGPATSSNGIYVPKTKDDNTPWRFDMNQNGKRMTSVEFDAWMKAKGIRVAKGRPDVEPVIEPVPECVPSKEVSC